MKTKRKDGFCVYIGPTILGVIQANTAYRGDKNAALEKAALAVGKYPETLPKLIVTDAVLPEARIRVKTPGNLLYKAYREILEEVKNNAAAGEVK